MYGHLGGEQFRNTEFEGEEFVDETLPDSRNLQGLLFHPRTAMQIPGDPLEDMDKRHTVIKETLWPVSQLDTGVKRGFTHSYIPTSVFNDTTGVTLKEGKYPSFYTKPHPIIGHRNYGEIHVPKDGDPFGVSQAYTHEFGHARDLNIHKNDAERVADYENRRRKRGQNYFVASPISEGLADGYADRYQSGPVGPGHGTPRLVSHIDPALNPDIAATMTQKDSGYQVDNRIWTTRQSQAVYAATRMHVAHHGEDGLKSLPNFNQLGRDYVTLYGDTASEGTVSAKEKELYDNRHFSEGRAAWAKHVTIHTRQAYLGELLHVNPALHAGLAHLGFADIADNAIQYRHKQQVLKAARESTQPALPGFKTNEEIALSQLKNTNPLKVPLTAEQLKRTDPHSRSAKIRRNREYNKKYWG